MNQLSTINFYGNTIFCINYNDELYVPIRPIIENLGLDWITQKTKIYSIYEKLNCKDIITVKHNKQCRILCIPLCKLNKLLNIVRSTMLYSKNCHIMVWNTALVVVISSNTILESFCITKEDLSKIMYNISPMFPLEERKNYLSYIKEDEFVCTYTFFNAIASAIIGNQEVYTNKTRSSLYKTYEVLKDEFITLQEYINEKIS